MISGRTRIIAHIGVPTESFLAPLIYNPWFAAHGIDTVVVPMGCEAADYPDFLRLVFRLRNIAGALITMPHKVTTVPLLGAASTAVRICGACNAVRRDEAGRLVGDMFDGEGFVRSLRRKQRRIEGASALVVGNGGVGSAIAAALAQECLARIGLFDIDRAATARLEAALTRHYPALQVATGSNDPAGWDIVVNASPLGANDSDPLPVDPARLDPASLVAEVVLGRAETPLVAAALARGCAVQPGTDMLYEQIPAYLAFFGYPGATAEELRRLSAPGARDDRNG
jgi:shikimate dehydrogenase